MNDTQTIPRAIEVGFPIVEINRLAVPERNSFKPIYQMHKWFARRASCVFRAILLGALKPAFQPDGTPIDLMAEFYKDHTNDPDTKGKHILDPFMGGGTTVVEGLRLGCKVTGIDLNPVAWFIVKTEVEPVDLNELEEAFERLAARPVDWNHNKPLRKTLLGLYKTEVEPGVEADVIYTFWVKHAICTDPNCGREVPLFKDYIIAKKFPSVRYFRDVTCPHCNKQGLPKLRSNKKERKKVPYTVLLCPECEAVWQWRGDLPEGELTCPACSHSYDPYKGGVPQKGKFLCPYCGNRDKIIESIRRLPQDNRLPIRPYALQAYFPPEVLNNDNSWHQQNKLFQARNNTREDREGRANSLTEGIKAKIIQALPKNGKFFMRFSASDKALLQQAERLWEQNRHHLPYPKSRIPVGEKTKSGLLAHHYDYWHEMFAPRQLLALSTLLKGIMEEQNQTMEEMLLCAFSGTLELSNQFCRYMAYRSSAGGQTVQGVFARHDYQPKITITENNVFGIPRIAMGSFNAKFALIKGGVEYKKACWDFIFEGKKREKVVVDSACKVNTVALSSEDGASFNPDNEVSHFITDPPYVGNVNYAELSDFFYVWLRLALKTRYLRFTPEYTPKAQEIIENRTRGKSVQDFYKDLAKVFLRVHESLSDGALLVFTFHHTDQEGKVWEGLLQSLCDTGFQIVAMYPIHGESESSLHLMDKENVSYDLIHVCRKRRSDPQRRSWAGIRQEVRRRARAELEAIQKGMYGKEPLLPADCASDLHRKMLADVQCPLRTGG